MSSLRLLDAHLHIKAGTSSLTLSAAIGSVFLNSTGAGDIGAVENLAQDNRVLPFFGLHPWNAAREGLEELKLPDLLVRRPGACIGECGLDFTSQYRASRDCQLKAFEDQLTLARDRNRPASVHSVRAWGAMLELLSSFSSSGLPFILHSFYGSMDIMKQLIALGGYISLSELSLRNPEKSAPVVREIPAGRLLIESDIPAGADEISSMNHFNILLNNYKTVAEIRSISVEKLADGVFENGEVFSNRETFR